MGKNLGAIGNFLDVDWVYDYAGDYFYWCARDVCPWQREHEYRFDGQIFFRIKEQDDD